jgi:hypothetical protein
LGPDAQAKALRNRIASVEAGNEGSAGRSKLPELRAQLELLAKGNFLEGERAAAIGAQAQARKELFKWTEDGDKLLGKEEQKRRELIKVETEGRRLVVAGLLTEKDLRERVAAVRAKYADKAPAGGDPFAADRDAAKSWAQFYLRFADAQAEAEGKTAQLTKSQVELVKFLESPAYKNMAEPARQLALQQAYAAIGAEQLNEANKNAAKLAAEAAKESARWMDELRKGAETIEQQADKLRVEAEASLLVVDGYRSLEQAIHLVEIARLRERQAKLQDGEDAAVLAIQREIDARQQLIDQIGQRDRRKAAEDDAKKAAADWKKTAEQINDTLTDALLRGFESGKGFARNLRDTVVNMFKTMVLRPVVSAIVSPVAQAITGTLGLSGLANAAGSAAGGFNALGAVGGIAGIGASLGAFGTAAGYGASALFGGTGLTALSGGASMVGAGSIASGLGMMAGVLGPIALGIAAFKPLFGRKLKEAGIEGELTADGFAGNSFAFYKGGLFRSNKTKRSPLDAVTDSLFDDAAQSVATSTRAYAEALGLPVSQINGFTQRIKLDLKGLDEAARNEAIDKAFKGFADGIAGRFAAQLSGQTKAGESASQTLQRVAESLLTVNAVRASLGQSLLSGTATSGGNASALLDQFGGAEAFASAAQGYLGAVYSETDRLALAQRGLVSAFAQLGQAVPATRDAYRALVDAQDLSTEAGRNTYAALIKLNGAFAELTKTTAGTGDAIQAEIDRLRGLGSTKQDKAGLLASFATNTAQARAGDAAALQALPSISKALEEAAAATAGSALDIARMREWLASSLTDTLKGVPGFAAGGDFGGGLRLVGEKGPELQVTGPARIYSAADTARLMRGGLGGDASAELLAEIAQRLARLEDSNRATAMHSSKTARLIERAMPDGDALATRTAAP